MIFKSADLGYLFFLIPLVGGLLYFGKVRRRRLLDAFVSSSMWEQVVPSFSEVRRFWKAALTLVGILFLIVSMLRPQYGVKFEKVSRKGQQIIIAVDTSLSMLAEDVPPSRFDHAKREILSLVENLKGDSLGLIAFSGSAFVQCPITIDYSAVRLFLDNLQVGSVPRPGTNIGSAISLALKSFGKKQRNNVLVLITDGESFEGDVMKQVKAAKKKGVRIYTIGVGTPSGEPLPILDDTKRVTGYKKDKNEQVILSKLDEMTLKRISKKTGGHYYLSNENVLVMDQLYSDLSEFEKQMIEDQMAQTHQDRYQYFLVFCFLFLFLDVMVLDRKKHRIDARRGLIDET